MDIGVIGKTYARLIGTECRSVAASRYVACLIIPLCMGISTLAGAATYAVSPSQSLGAAVARLQPGDTLILRGGIYRAAIALRARNWSAATPTTIMGAAGENAVIKASNIVRGWAPLGDGVWIKQSWSVNSQQVFVNGRALQQIGGTVFGNYSGPNCNLGYYSCGDYIDQTGGIWPGRINGDQNNLTENSFYYDQAGKVLYVKVPATTDLNAQTVEVSVRQYLLHGRGIRGLTIKNLHFEHGNASALSRGSAFGLVNSHNNIIDNISIVYADSYAMIVHGNDNIIRNSVISHAGETGMGGSGERNRIINNELSHNNYRGFHPDWDAGGTKFIADGGIAGAPSGLKNSQVAGNRFIFNNGPGFWCDYCDGGNRVYGNIAAHNLTYGLYLEVSHGERVYNNYVFGNAREGIFVSGSNDGLIAHNLSAFNVGANISVRERPSSVGPMRNTVIGNISASNRGPAPASLPIALCLPAVLGVNSANYNLYVTEELPAFQRGRRLRVAGLPRWRVLTGQDINSWSEILVPLEEIQAAVDQSRIDVNWAGLFQIARKYSVPPILDSALNIPTYRPGPVLRNSP